MEERIALMRDDPAVELTVAANAIAGLLAQVFEREVTMLEERCAHCGTTSVIGTLRVYMRGPGVVARCPACAETVLRIVETPRGRTVDLSGTTYLAKERAG
jgi:endogenous inhibitor of DNA gyrase (YacG/DUF329 family)